MRLLFTLIFLLFLAPLVHAQCGPPNYPCSSIATSNPGNITPIFHEVQLQGTITSITVSGGTATVVWATNPGFATSQFIWISGTNQAGCNGKKVQLTSSTTYVAGTCVSSTGGTAIILQSCDATAGDCQNATKYDLTLNFPGHNCVTMLTDATTFPASVAAGNSIGNFTISAGSSDKQASAQGTYLAYVREGQTAYIIQLRRRADGCYQVVNTGIPAISCAGGPMGFDAAVDNYFYCASGTVLSKYTLTNINSMPTPDWTFDFKANCTEVPGTVWGSLAGVFVPSDDGNRFTFIATTGQAAGDWIVSYDRSIPGCSAVSFATGQVWDFTGTSIGTLDTTGNSCWGSNGSGGDGFHDNIPSPGGLYTFITKQPGTGWTQGVCAGNSNANQFVSWQIGTTHNYWCDGETTNHSVVAGHDTSHCGSHSSVGTNLLAITHSTGDLIRPSGDVTTSWSFFNQQMITASDYHFSWLSHNLGGVDQGPVLHANDSVSSSQGSGAGCTNANLCPAWPQNLIIAEFPKGVNIPAASIVHTFSCGTSTLAAQACPDGAFDNFGPGSSIGIVDPTGRWFAWGSTHLHNLGTDSNGQFRAEAFLVSLDSTSQSGFNFLPFLW